MKNSTRPSIVIGHDPDSITRLRINSLTAQRLATLALCIPAGGAFIFLIVLWGTGWGLAGNTTVTFSELLVEFPDVIPYMYFFWLGFYFLACIFIIVMIFVYFDDYQVTVHKDTFRVAVQRSFIALQYLYLVATLAKITGLFTLYFYNPNTQSAAHDAAAGTAFVAAVCCSLFMLIRRAIIVCVHESHAASKISPSINEPLLEKSTEDEFIKKREEFEKRKNWNQILIIITVLSSLFLATELGLLISLLPDGPRDGRVEFCLVFFNVFDNFWLIAEFHLDPQGLDRYVIFRRYTR